MVEMVVIAAEIAEERLFRHAAIHRAAADPADSVITTVWGGGRRVSHGRRQRRTLQSRARSADTLLLFVLLQVSLLLGDFLRQ